MCSDGQARPGGVCTRARVQDSLWSGRRGFFLLLLLGSRGRSLPKALEYRVKLGDEVNVGAILEGRAIGGISHLAGTVFLAPSLAELPVSNVTL